ncbi:hypothetical protein RND81_04G185800 [Saponaria officinalis]|uniref:Transcription repressor n=1 Tax=Saponaria officinalis TaxID=3572 RepID=A0AAW1LKW6_SAPOF
MGLKVKLLPSLLFKVPSCTQPKTSSFRLTMSMKDDIFKTINSVYFDHESELVETPDSWFTNSASRLSASDEYDEPSMSISGDIHLEAIIRGAQQSSSASNRLLFDPTAEDSPKLGPTAHQESTSTLKGSDVRNLTSNSKKNNNKKTPFKESVAMSVESENPYEDFKRSMEEMVESLKVKNDWEELEELLGWYLKVNGRKYHGYIISAFIDLIVGIIGNNSNSSCDELSSTSEVNCGYKNDIVRSSTSFCSATSSLTSSSCGSTSD